MTLRYNANLVSEGAIKDSEGNKITTTYAKSANLATVATSGDYTDLSNTPTIGDGTITITQGGVTKGSFTTNQSGDATIALDAGAGGGVTDVEVNGTSVVSGGVASISVPTNNNQLSNGAGYITGINSSDVTTALGYTPESQANKVTTISSSSTDTQYPSAKCVYDELANKADKDLSNLTATSSTNFDGAVVYKGVLILDGTPNATNTSTNLKTTGYLPNDSYEYEVSVSISLRSTSTAVTASVRNTPLDAAEGIGGAARVGSNSTYSYNNFWMPLGTNGIIYYKTDAKPSLGISIRLLGYRRIGTNT